MNEKSSHQGITLENLNSGNKEMIKLPESKDRLCMEKIRQNGIGLLKSNTGIENNRTVPLKS